MSEPTTTRAVKTKLSEQERQQLMTLASHPGYGVLLMLMQTHCILADNALIKVDPADEKRVLAEHRIAVATWNFFSVIQEQVEYEIKELKGENDQQPGPTAEERETAAIVDPLAPQDV